ncbi:MAG TPA: pseudouridine synthase [Stellaceae bacterium]|nr:pseudouridine synthase [Stellaceae bacterium]
MTDTTGDGAEAPPKGERIAKRLARAGLCSRRDAERWIAEGRVAVDGVVLTSPAFNVDEGSIVMVDGKPLPDAAPTRLWRYHKPAGLVTSHRDEKGRATLFETLPAELGRVISVGRLDLTSEGLLLLTNDGALARRLELPAMGWIRRYKVRVNGYVDPVKLLPLERGPTIEGIKYGPIKVELERQQGANAWLTVSLTEGKNREIRRVFEHLGYAVNRLIRLSYGPFQLGSLAVGTVEEVPRKVLAEQLGDKAPTHAKAKPVAKRPTTPRAALPDHSTGKAKPKSRSSAPPSTRNRDADRRR